MVLTTESTPTPFRLRCESSPRLKNPSQALHCGSGAAHGDLHPLRRETKKPPRYQISWQDSKAELKQIKLGFPETRALHPLLQQYGAQRQDKG